MVASSFRDSFSVTSAISLHLVSQLSASAASLFICAQPSRRHHESKAFLPSLPETRSLLLYNFLGGRTSPVLLNWLRLACNSLCLACSLRHRERKTGRGPAVGGILLRHPGQPALESAIVNPRQTPYVFRLPLKSSPKKRPVALGAAMSCAHRVCALRDHSGTTSEINIMHAHSSNHQQFTNSIMQATASMSSENGTPSQKR